MRVSSTHTQQSEERDQSFLAFLRKVFRLEADNKDLTSKIHSLKADVEMYQEVLPDWSKPDANQKLPKQR